MKKALTLIFLEDGYRETEIIQNTFLRVEDMIILGHAHSELKLVRMLKEFLPDFLLLKSEMISYEFLLKLYPLINNSDVKIFVSSPNYKEEEKIKDLFKKLKFNTPFYFLQIRPSDNVEILAEKFSVAIKNLLKTSPVRVKEKAEAAPGHEKAEKLIIIGSSAGGPRILKNILLQMPDRVPASIVIVQHIPSTFSQTLVESLSHRTQLNMKEAEEGDVLYNNIIYVAKGDYHLEIVRRGQNKCLHLHKGPKVWSVRPAIDVTMISAAKVFKNKIIAVILTGIGNDGTEGVKVIKKAGGTVIAQDQATSLIYGMPKSAVESGCVDFVLPYYKISDVSVNLVKEK